MPISRDARMDRRRRLLREVPEESGTSEAAPRRSSRRAALQTEPEGAVTKRKAGYSQDVRRACGQRLVQLIPVRKRSYAAVSLASLLIPGLLIAAHYAIHVTGQLQWWRHPLAVALDIGHPRSIAAWLSSQIWLLCLAATVLTFQLRRHKLDDYNGEYRLWFWLVITCLVASIDSTTSLTELFATALHPWAQLQLGWSGSAVVDATLAVLIGMLGLRMCTELKVVPLSLAWWLTGLIAWASSAALARPEFRLELSAPIRYWLTAASWLGGLTMIWLAALTYLRTVYLEAQQRFLLRAHSTHPGMPLTQRLREALPPLPRLGRGRTVTDDSTADGEVSAPGVGVRRLPRLPSFTRRTTEGIDDGVEATARKAAPSKTSKAAPTHGLRGLFRLGANEPVVDESNGPLERSPSERKPVERSSAQRSSNDRSAERPADNQRTTATDTASAASRPGRWSGWLRRPKDSGDAEEYRKLRSAEAGEDSEQAETATSTGQRRWLPKVPRPRLTMPRLGMPQVRMPKVSLPRLSRKRKVDEAELDEPRKSQSQTSRQLSSTAEQAAPARGGLMSRLKFPKFGLSALRLDPPSSAPPALHSPPRSASLTPVSTAARPLPGTQSAGTQSAGTQSVDQLDAFEDDVDGRSMSKAERKRLRRQQQQQGRRTA